MPIDALPPEILPQLLGPTTEVVRQVPAVSQRVELGNDTYALLPPPGSNQRLMVYVNAPAPRLPGPAPAAANGLSIDADLQRAIIEEATRHLGYREGRNNRNMFSAHYRRDYEPWCADFVSYVFEQVGRPIGPNHRGFASVRLMADWFSDQGRLFQSGPQPGDTIFFNNARKGRWNHVGLVERVSNGTVHTIEGNAGRGLVARRAYAITNPAIIGYGRLPEASASPRESLS